MTDVYILDTHTLIWFLTGDKKLGKEANKVLSVKTNRFILPMIALAEAFDIVQKRRTKIADVETLMQKLLADPRIEIQPLTLDILLESQNALAVPEMHDRIITATALNCAKRGLNVAIVTKDETIIAANLTEIVWN